MFLHVTEQLLSPGRALGWEHPDAMVEVATLGRMGPPTRHFERRKDTVLDGRRGRFVVLQRRLSHSGHTLPFKTSLIAVGFRLSFVSHTAGRAPRLPAGTWRRACGH